MGVRYFDIRYSFIGNNYVVSHTYATNYSVYDAINELVSCASSVNEYVYIRLKRDSASVALPGFGAWFSLIKINNNSVLNYFVKNDIQDISSLLNKKPLGTECIILYSDDTTLHDDNVSAQVVFSQIFDTVETWQCGEVDDAVKLITNPTFKNNGLLKAIFIDFSANYPPEIAFKLVWEKVEDKIVEYSKNNTIQCVMINNVDDKIIKKINLKI